MKKADVENGEIYNFVECLSNVKIQWATSTLERKARTKRALPRASHQSSLWTRKFIARMVLRQALSFLPNYWFNLLCWRRKHANQKKTKSKWNIWKCCLKCSSRCLESRWAGGKIWEKYFWRNWLRGTWVFISSHYCGPSMSIAVLGFMSVHVT